MKDLNFFPDKSKKIAVGLSGGVDSSVAAARLVKMGYKVIGFWMWLSGGDGSSSLRSVRCNVGPPREPYVKNNNCLTTFRVCQFLKIPFYIIDLRKEFAKAVIDYFLEEYKNGQTPNSCIVCNQKIKFGRMLKITTEKLKADYLATGQLCPHHDR